MQHSQRMTFALQCNIHVVDGPRNPGPLPCNETTIQQQVALRIPMRQENSLARRQPAAWAARFAGE